MFGLGGWLAVGLFVDLCFSSPCWVDAFSGRLWVSSNSTSAFLFVFFFVNAPSTILVSSWELLELTFIFSDFSLSRFPTLMEGLCSWAAATIKTDAALVTGVGCGPDSEANLSRAYCGWATVPTSFLTVSSTLGGKIFFLLIFSWSYKIEVPKKQTLQAAANMNPET